MKYWRNFDWLLLGIPVLMVLFSTVMLYAISRWAPEVPHSTPEKQALYLMAGLVVYFILTNLDYKVIRAWITPMYVATLIALVGVSLLGHSANGSQRWFNLGFIQLQPSEPAKLVVILMLARLFADRESKIKNFSTLILSLAVAGIPAALVMRQPDFGTAMVLGAVWFVITVIASTPPVYVGGVAATAGAAAPFAWNLLKPYQRNRFTSFLQPNKDPLGSGWNIIHARIAVGSGGPFGQWFSRATQSRLDFLRVQDKDFIFSVIAEQVGFFGVLVLFLFFGIVLMRIARVAFMSGDVFGRLAAAGILTMFLFQMFVNVGMNIGIMPVTGIPLPLISYGGSSLITSFAGLGILQSILIRNKKLMFGTR
ncbi:MAG TPA: rod shape-determining protein RodA [Chloroflexota bacterium]|nr:rod shape-determining protein RodA [Chloroflexota bacterium]